MRETQLKSRLDHKHELERDIDPMRVVEEANEKVKLEAMLKFQRSLIKVKKFEEVKRGQQEEAGYKMQEDRQKRLQIRDVRLKHLNDQETRKVQSLRKQQKEREKALNQMRSIQQEDLEHRREISFLKKLDQEENLERTRNFYVLLLPYMI